MTTGADGRGLAGKIEDVVFRSGCVDRPADSLRERLRRQGCSVRSWTDRPDTRHPPHEHPYSHRVLCVSGWIEFTVKGDTYRLEPGNALDLPGGVTHSAVTCSDESTEYWLLQPD